MFKNNKIVRAILVLLILSAVAWTIEFMFYGDKQPPQVTDMLGALEEDFVSLDCVVTSDVGSSAELKFDIDLGRSTAQQQGFPSESVRVTPTEVELVTNVGFKKTIRIARSDLTLTTSTQIGDRPVKETGACKIVERDANRVALKRPSALELTDRRFFSSPLTLKKNYPFSDLVVVGKTVYFSGLVGIDGQGSLVGGGIEAETDAIFKQLKAHLASQRLDLTHVVKCLVMLDDIREWSQFNRVYTGYFKPPYPVRSALGANGLALGAAIEMECMAVTP